MKKDLISKFIGLLKKYGEDATMTASIIRQDTKEKIQYFYDHEFYNGIIFIKEIEKYLGFQLKLKPKIIKIPFILNFFNLFINSFKLLTSSSLKKYNFKYNNKNQNNSN